MANCKYMLFGSEFIESQGKMMARVFQELLSRHPEQIQAALKQFSCLSAIDYNQNIQSFRDAPSAFLNKKTFTIGGQTICIGTSYNMKQKQAHMKRLFLLCGEDLSQFQIVDDHSSEPTVKIKPEKSAVYKKEGNGRVRYRLFGRSYESSQAEMMYCTIQEILSRKPELVEWAAENLHCVSWTDYTLAENKREEMPLQFRNSRLLQIDGKNICIGSSYNLKAKLDLIDRLLHQANMPEGVFMLYPELHLNYWQKRAVEAVLRAYKGYGRDDQGLGIISMPTGTGKTAMLAAMCLELFQLDEKNLFILLLTGRAKLALQYKEMLSELLGKIYPVEIAETRKALSDKAGVPGTVLVSTAQKLLERTSLPDKAAQQEALIPYSTSSHMLVVVEEIAYNYFSRTYRNMRARFPHARFLGMTNDWQPSKRLKEIFGDVLYVYSYEQAYHDGFLRLVDYYCVYPAEGTGQTGAPSKRAAGIHPEIYFDTGESYRNKTELMAGWIGQSEKDVLALLLCNSHRDAVGYYEALKACDISTKIESYVKLFPDDRQYIPRSASWDGHRFHGIVIACSPDSGGIPFDLVFLDQEIKSAYHLLAIVSLLTKRGEHNKEANGVLVDFQNGEDTITGFLPPNYPIHICDIPSDVQSYRPAETASFEAGLEKLSAELSGRQFSAARETFLDLQRKFPADGKQLSQELEFLFDPLLSAERQKSYWEQHPIEVEWKNRLWCLLSRHSKRALDISDEREDDEQEASTAAETDHEDPVQPASPGGTSQERGNQLEKATLELFRRLFELDKTENADVLEKLRRQKSGGQYGFDVTFTYRDRFGVAVTCKVECKNYQNGSIRLQDVVPKLAALQHTGKQTDHWILISPNGQVSNELSEVQEEWQNTFRWEPVRDIQFWTQDENVRELFALFPDLYKAFYGEWEDSIYKKWSEEKREEVFKYWKAKLAPVPLLPLNWRKYLREPAKLLTQCEGDRATCERYECLYGNYVPMRLLDEGEIPMGGTAEAYIRQWLGCADKHCILLLGDFGDGKTYFTYTLARKTAKEFMESPEHGWIPLRLTLSDLRDSLMDCRDFLHRRLREFDGTLSEWNDIQRKYKFLVILDGLDEMSLGMSDTAVLENLGRLEELIDQFKGHKLIITSRKMAIYADKIRERILDCLDHPEILHLAPITQSDCLAFLKSFVNTPQRREHLLKLQNTHDLLGLAAKPLFLEMMQVLLDDDIKELDAAGIYQQYTEKVLQRKFKMQLRMENDYTNPGKIRANVMQLLEKLALCLQTEGLDSISLDDFKRKIGQDNLADMLWDTIRKPDASMDADSRMINRSLLKYDSMDSAKACFCHRSMKEYFVARGLIRCLKETPDKGKALLMACDFGYEILEFAGKAVLQLSRRAQRDLAQNLYNFVHETKGKAGGPLKESFERLGTNSVNLLYYAGFQLQDADWSGLLLNHVILSGMDLSGKDFSFSSMRYAHMENTNLNGCNLRGCDFTGVQFEKSGQLMSFAVDTKSGNLLAVYKDGKIRRWFITDGSSHLLAEFKQRYNCRITLREDGCEGIIQSGYLRFWRRTARKLSTSGGVCVYDHTRILDIGKFSVLLWQRGILCLVDLRTGTILSQRETPENIRACLLTDRTFFVYRREQGVEFYDLSGREPVMCVTETGQPVTAISSRCVAQTEGFLAIGYKNGFIRSYFVKRKQGNGHWEFAVNAALSEEGEAVSEIDMDEMGRIYAGSPKGMITRYKDNGQGELLIDKSYQLEIKCTGAQIDGVRPEEQYEILLQAKNVL